MILIYNSLTWMILILKSPKYFDFHFKITKIWWFCPSLCTCYKGNQPINRFKIASITEYEHISLFACPEIYSIILASTITSVQGILNKALQMNRDIWLYGCRDKFIPFQRMPLNCSAWKAQASCVGDKSMETLRRWKFENRSRRAFFFFNILRKIINLETQND